MRARAVLVLSLALGLAAGCRRHREPARRVVAPSALNAKQRQELVAWRLPFAGESLVLYYDATEHGGGTEAHVLTTQRILTFRQEGRYRGSGDPIWSAVFDQIGGARREGARLVVRHVAGPERALEFANDAEARTMYGALCRAIPGRCLAP